MKIAYLSSSVIPSRTANSIHVMKMCQAFAKNGHEVLLFCAKAKGEQKDGTVNEFAYYGVDPVFEIRKLPWPNIKGKAIIYVLSMAYHAKKAKPDVVYGRHIFGCFAAAFLGLKTVVEIHKPPADDGVITSFIFKQLLKSPNLMRVVVISKALKDYLGSRYKITDKLIKVAHDGADVPNRNSQQERVKENGRMQAGYLGHLYPGKGAELVYEIAKLCPWADFHLVGGAEKDILLWKEKAKGMPNIIFHGFVVPSKTEALCASFDVLLAPYQTKVALHSGKGDTSKWMSPLKIFEYMASGRPIICSDIPVLREILKHNCTAFLCPPREVNAWCKALETLRDNPSLRRSMAQKAKEEFLALYTWQSRATKVLDGI